MFSLFVTSPPAPCAAHKTLLFEILSMSSIINSFELVALSFSWIIGGGFRASFVDDARAKKSRENIKICSAAVRASKHESSRFKRQSIFLSFHFLESFLLWCTREEAEKWKVSAHSLWCFSFFPVHFSPFNCETAKKTFASWWKKKINFNLLVVIFACWTSFFNFHLRNDKLRVFLNNPFLIGGLKSWFFRPLRVGWTHGERTFF